MILQGRNAVITGASTGLGLVIAQTFLAEGANVAICSRHAEQLEAARSCLTHHALPGQSVFAQPCDVSQESQVRDFAHAAEKHFGRVQILINNAGILGPMGETESVEFEEWRRTIEINLFGTFLFCKAFIPGMRANGYGKLVNLSGGGATSPRPFFSAYAAAKAGVVRLTENLAEELRETNIDVNSVAPGALNTRMLSQVLEAGPDSIGHKQFAQAIKQKDNGGGSFEKAAALCVYLSSGASDGITGKLISAPWDPWPALHERRDLLSKSDIYALRRIVPEDRGESWS